MNFLSRVCLMYIILGLVPDLDARCYQVNCLQCEHGPCTECSHGWYGADCLLRCVGCQTDGCEQFTGRCIKCSPGFYGDFCNINCPVNCLESNSGVSFCNRSTGHCLEGCEKSFWGSQCDKHCSQNCLQSVCEQRTGECPNGCNDGFYGFQCDKHCTENCLSNCSSLKGTCFSCKRGFCGSQCNISNHHCKECIYNELDETVSCVNGCKDGWTSENCSERCSERCKDQLCEKDGKCKACREGYFGQDCLAPITKTQMINFDSVATSKYESRACREDYPQWLMFALTVVVFQRCSTITCILKNKVLYC